MSSDPKGSKHLLLKNELWSRAQKVVVGGCGLLSKRPTRYAGELWPSYFTDAKGILVKSIGGKWYQDFSEFSIGCNLLGYSDKRHRSFITSKILRNPLTSLLSPYEVELAERLNFFFEENRSWKFCRGGGEALALATRYARSAGKNTKTIVCGYHGWHDWYMSCNIVSSNSLDSIFLKGLSTNGIPNAYASTTIAADPEDPLQLKSIIQNEKPGVIVFESARYKLLAKETINILKSFQAEGGILVADEVTSGFRFDNKLACNSSEIKPDFLVLGKSLGSGYAISAVGLLNIHREAAEACFASSTHWTEQIGLAAGCATIRCISNWSVTYDQLKNTGQYMRESIIKCFEGKNFEFNINDLPTMISFSFANPNYSEQQCKALLCALMLERGFLFSTTIYPSLKHKRLSIRSYSSALFAALSELEYLLDEKGTRLHSLLGQIGLVESGFARIQVLNR